MHSRTVHVREYSVLKVLPLVVSRDEIKLNVTAHTFIGSGIWHKQKNENKTNNSRTCHSLDCFLKLFDSKTVQTKAQNNTLVKVEISASTSSPKWNKFTSHLTTSFPSTCYYICETRSRRQQTAVDQPRLSLGKGRRAHFYESKWNKWRHQRKAHKGAVFRAKTARLLKVCFM